MSKYGVFSGPYFPVFGLNTEIYGVNSLCGATSLIKRSFQCQIRDSQNVRNINLREIFNKRAIMDGL